MATTSNEKELVALENRYWQALKERDTKTALELSDFPVLLTGPQGVGRIEREAFTTMMNDTRYTVTKADLSDVEVRMLADDVAIVAYRVHEEMTVDGEPVTIDAADASTWIRRNGRWVCALHTEALVGDPFGRDRKS